MGRTARKRNKNRNNSISLDHELATINLNKFMKNNGFHNNSNLKLRNFAETGRGVSSTKSFKENDILISVPYNLMITYTTLQSMNYSLFLLPKTKLKIHDLLAFFLVIERHKNNESFWFSYIKSLPVEAPWLPMQMSADNIDLLPSDLRLYAIKSRNLLEESWLRVKKSINPAWTCHHCNQTLECVLNWNSFAWGYILVNTRAVYVNPEIVAMQMSTSHGESDILSDEPSMALCPYLDMFNHNDTAQTQADLIYNHQGQLFYQLTTLTKAEKHKQIFISYGPHDNPKLITEYGFFLKENRYDTFKFNEDELFRVLTLKLNQIQYRFLREHNFNRDLFISKELGPSFNLKAFLFCCLNPEVRQITSIIYTDTYPEHFYVKIQELCSKLIDFKLKSSESELKTFVEHLSTFNLLPSFLIDYMNYKINCLNNFLL